MAFILKSLVLINADTTELALWQEMRANRQDTKVATLAHVHTS